MENRHRFKIRKYGMKVITIKWEYNMWRIVTVLKYFICYFIGDPTIDIWSPSPNNATQASFRFNVKIKHLLLGIKDMLVMVEHINRNAQINSKIEWDLKLRFENNVKVEANLDFTNFHKLCNCVNFINK